MRFPRSRSARIGLAAVPIVLVAGAVTGAVAAASPSSGHAVTVSAKGCAHGWSAPSSGVTTFDVRNRSTTATDLVLERSTQAVVAEIPTLGPNVERPLRVVLEPGTYTWRCTSINGNITSSEAETVSGDRVAAPSPSYQPVTADDLTTAALAYRASITSGLNQLATDTDALDAAVGSGNVPAAESAWLTAHLDYERLGAVYDTFGDFNDEINGRADGLAQGVNDPGFTGFLRLEYALWHGQPQATDVAVADQLDKNVHGLVADFPHELTPATDVPLRAHEILENALQFELTGDTDEGSHTNLATVRANIDGENIVLNALQQLLDQRDPHLLSAARADLTSLAALVDTYRSPSGVWTPVTSLTQAQHEALDGRMDATLALLDQIPAQLEQASGDSG